jgi:hypothetical protein
VAFFIGYPSTLSPRLWACISLSPPFTRGAKNVKRVRSEVKWAVLKKIVDALTTPNTIPDPLLLLIRYADDFQTEKDVEFICYELKPRHFSDPFGLFKLKCGEHAFDGKRLKVLRDARLSRFRIGSENDADNYIIIT